MQPDPAAQTALPATQRRSPWLLAVTAVSLVLLLLCVAYVFSLRSQLAELDSSSRRSIDAQMQTIVMQTQQVEALDRIAVKVDELNREIGASAGKLQMNENLEAGIADLKARPHLPDEAKKTLADLEQSMAAIREMEAKMKELERYLGAPAVVKRGDSHSEIARRYLIGEARLEPSEADRVLRRTALAWELEPGNLVFNLYHEGTLLTTVAQGTAKRSPLIAQWARREAVKARINDLEQKLAACQAGPAVPADAAAEPAAAPAAGAEGQPAAEGAAAPAAE